MTTNPDDRFGWTRFYMEFANKLLEHRDDRSLLVAKVREVCNNRGYRYLDNSGTAEEDAGLTDICPFTVMGSFNRGISDTNRNGIAAELGEFLGVNEPAASSFEGIPTLHSMKSVVFWDRSDIDKLWQVFDDAVQLSDFNGDTARRSFLTSFDSARAARGVGATLTIGLFWIRPHTYLTLDSKSKAYIANSLGIILPDRVPPPGSDYLALLDKLKEQFRITNFPVHSFQELSVAAYEPPGNGGAPTPEGGGQSDELDSSSTVDQEAEDQEECEYSIQNIVSDGCFLPQPKLETILRRLKSKKNLILQGPPGTGKTWLAKKLAFALIEQQSEHLVRRFQFHPNMSYEDFIRGFRPEGDGTLNLVDGPLLEVINDAKNDPDSKYVMVIEEINRGNPAQIFGEMLTLLEADKRDPSEALTLAYPKYEGERVHIPPNVYVIGTMNVADRSIAIVDFALRRRFAFVDLEPVFGDVWRDWVHEQCGIPLDFLTDIEQRITSLNEQIAADRTLGPQFRIGHSYVTSPVEPPISEPVEWFKQVVETEIGPLLDEYWFDDAQKAESAKLELLAGL